MIYYVSSSGTVIGGTSASNAGSLSGITHLPANADYAIYVDDGYVSALNPNNEPGMYSFTGISPSSSAYTVPTATGTLTFTELSAAEQLANAQAAQISLLRAGYAATIASGFNATIEGTQYTFGWQLQDQVNLNSTQSAIANGYLSYPVQYGDINGNPVTIGSATDLQALEQTATKFMSAQHQQILTLIGQVQAVNASTTNPVQTVQAITWSAATY